jgi:arabinose-5-phosphate isomerase
MHENNATIELGQQFLKAEIEALQQVTQRLDSSFSEAVRVIRECEGTVILSGVGKSYFIAQKISASLASTGTPSIALHPVDALHGDMGRIRAGDVVINLSNSGSSSEVVEFTRATRELDVIRIAVTCRAESPVAMLSNIVLDMGPLEEACPMGVAPSTTSTAMLALGDALTLTVMTQRGFSIESFAKNHPGGALGRRLRSIGNACRPLSETVVVNPTESILETLRLIALKRCGAAFVVDDQARLLGVFTDGDVRRMASNDATRFADQIGDHMTTPPKTVYTTDSVQLALDSLRAHQVNSLAVIDHDNVILGHIDIQDIA